MNAHPQYEEDFDLYELGVLDGSDKVELESHLAGCRECRAKLEAARNRVALFVLAAPPTEPPPAARERILESFRARGPERAKREASAPRRGFWMPAWAWGWAGVCLLLLGAAGWFGITNHRLAKRIRELDRAYQQLEASNLDLKTQAARAQAVMDVLTGPESVQVELSPASAPPLPHGKAFYNRDKGLLFYTTSLRALPRDRAYELWLIPTVGKPVDIGVFNTDTQGNGQVILTALPHGVTAKAFAVTVERASGVPAPTGPMVLVGPVS